MKKNHTHDCSKCIFLGNYSTIVNYEHKPIEGKKRVYDLYYCSWEPTVIARYSDHGNDYRSGLFSSHPAIHKGIKIALTKKLLSLSDIRQFTENYNKFKKLFN